MEESLPNSWELCVLEHNGLERVMCAPARITRISSTKHAPMAQDRYPAARKPGSHITSTTKGVEHKPRVCAVLLGPDRSIFNPSVCAAQHSSDSASLQPRLQRQPHSRTVPPLNLSSPH
jgi:hypothetical protein